MYLISVKTSIPVIFLYLSGLKCPDGKHNDPLHSPPIRHRSSDTTQASDLDDLLVPAQQNAHGSRGRFVCACWSAGDLAEAAC